MLPRPLARPRLPRTIDLRPSARERGYDADWVKLQRQVLADEPLCRRCARRGLVTAAELVDHITPIRDGGERLSRSNLQPLCRKCHGTKTGQDLVKRHTAGVA